MKLWVGINSGWLDGWIPNAGCTTILGTKNIHNCCQTLIITPRNIGPIIAYSTYGPTTGGKCLTKDRLEGIGYFHNISIMKYEILWIHNNIVHFIEKYQIIQPQGRF